MPSEVLDGGPAFPQHVTHAGNPVHAEFASGGGMTLRDWFAGMWLQGASAQMDVQLTEERARATADEAYRAADAMIVRRAIGGDQQ